VPENRIWCHPENGARDGGFGSIFTGRAWKIASI
jgi:hypothetical protein